MSSTPDVEFYCDCCHPAIPTISVATVAVAVVAGDDDDDDDAVDDGFAVVADASRVEIDSCSQTIPYFSSEPPCEASTSNPVNAW